MKAAVLMLSLVVFTAMISFAGETKHQYVGVQVCSMCHKADKNGQQFQKWQASKHSQAMKVLESADADKIATAHGVKGKAADAKECLVCHQTAFDEPASMIGPEIQQRRRRTVRILSWCRK